MGIAQLFGFSGGASKGWQTGTNSGSTGVDAATQAKIDEIYRAAQASGGAMPQGVQQGMDAITGKQGAIDQFMNPYQQQVINAANKQWDYSGQQAQLGVNDAATQSGAFGGSRQGVASGVAAAQNTLNRNSQITGLMGQGFESAMGRAGQAVNFGMQGAGSPEAWRLQQLRQGFAGMPYGQTYRGTSGQTNTGMNFGFGGR